ncbi:DUF998 domain-containing protein [Trueperella bialowiezensis]|nr:DUF998 domain-containing protein [Trueperella bialowiezensis]
MKKNGTPVRVQITPGKIAFAVLIAVLYNSWVWWTATGSHSPFIGYLSELAAKDQPASWFFRSADCLAAITVGVLAIVGARRWRGWLGAAAGYLSAALGAFAVFTVVDAVFPMPCATTFDAACKAREAENFFAPEFFMHTAASTLVGTAIMVSVAVVWWVHRSRGVLAVGLLIGGAMLATIAIAFTVGRGHGIWQAIQVLATTGWFAYLIFHLDADSSLDARFHPGARRVEAP